MARGGCCTVGNTGPAPISGTRNAAATAEAIRDARTLTNLEAGDVLGPLVSDAALTNDSLRSLGPRSLYNPYLARVRIVE